MHACMRACVYAYVSAHASAHVSAHVHAHVRRPAAEESMTAYELDPQYKIAFKRAAQAHLALNEKATVKLAVRT